MEDINVSKSFQMNDITDSLLFNLQDHENISITIYKLTGTIRNKFFNHKQIMELIKLYEGQSLNDDIYPCNFENSKFCDPDRGRIITGDRPLIKNQKLRKLFTKGPNFREPQWAIEEFAGSLRLKHTLEDTAMDLWVNKVLEKVKKKKIKSLKKSK